MSEDFKWGMGWVVKTLYFPCRVAFQGFFRPYFGSVFWLLLKLFCCHPYFDRVFEEDFRIFGWFLVIWWFFHPERETNKNRERKEDKVIERERERTEKKEEYKKRKERKTKGKRKNDLWESFFCLFSFVPCFSATLSPKVPKTLKNKADSTAVATTIKTNSQSSTSSLCASSLLASCHVMPSNCSVCSSFGGSSSYYFFLSFFFILFFVLIFVFFILLVFFWHVLCCLSRGCDCINPAWSKGQWRANIVQTKKTWYFAS